MKQGILFVSLFLVAGALRAQVGDSLEVAITPEDAALFKQQLEQISTDPSTLPATREYASEKMEVRKFDPKRWREVVGGRDYNDTRKRKKPPEKQEQQRKIESESSDQEPGPRRRAGDSDDAADYDEGYDGGGDPSVGLGFLGPIMQLVFYCVIAAIIILILYQIARNISYRSNPKKAADKSKSPDEVHDITELDTEGLIRNAHLAGNYKLAIRLYFLHLLKKLNENGVIVWTKDKTNRDYLSELFSKQYYFDEVRKLTLAYERVWYGEHVPTAETYETLSSEFKAIDQKLNATSRP